MSFSPKMTITEVAKIRLAIAIRSTIKISKKVLFIVCKTMKNGAMWVSYKIDGKKCSTFVSRAKFEKCISKASNSQEFSTIFQGYVNELISEYPNLSASYSRRCLHITKIVPNRIKDIKMNYVIAHDDDNGNFRLVVDMGNGTVYSPSKLQTVNTFRTIKEAISHIGQK